MTNVELLKELKDLISHHERFSCSFFWSPPSAAASRREYEETNSKKLDFIYREQRYNIELNISCSCKNVYYKGIFRLDGRTKDVRVIKKIIKDLETPNSYKFIKED